MSKLFDNLKTFHISIEEADVSSTHSIMRFRVVAGSGEGLRGEGFHPRGVAHYMGASRRWRGLIHSRSTVVPLFSKSAVDGHVNDERS